VQQEALRYLIALLASEEAFKRFRRLSTIPWFPTSLATDHKEAKYHLRVYQYRLLRNSRQRIPNVSHLADAWIAFTF
jgi:hypothetical protein